MYIDMGYLWRYYPSGGGSLHTYVGINQI